MEEAFSVSLNVKLPPQLEGFFTEVLKAAYWSGFRDGALLVGGGLLVLFVLYGFLRWK